MLADATTIDQLIGYEGAASPEYFRVCGTCSGTRGFNGRQRSPPDPINAMLSFGHTCSFIKRSPRWRWHAWILL
ncbi:CRISPR-associated endonuclease Cas1 [Streptosporangiaceae bacterium NEAU-GS5]|nr:CRISPR-associated endonuclease Cas1 [Streptosporangiaceae bacterium NEAU-GS5]